MDKLLKPLLKASLIPVMGITLVACAGVIERPDGRIMALNSKEFRAYVGAVFRHQNRLADALAFAIVDGDSESHLQRLENAEQRLISACAGVNELATAERDGAKLGVWRKRRLARQVVDCQIAAGAAEKVLAAP